MTRALFGLDERDGEWFAVVIVHNPCRGGEHVGCKVMRRYESGPHPDSETAAAACRSFATRLESEGLGTIREVTS